jgi:hypothetical protein
VDIILKILKTYPTESKLISNICWCLVIICRALGKSEGSSVNIQSMEIDMTMNVNLLMKFNIIDLVVNVCRIQSHCPNTLAKCYWSLVNLGIQEEHKVKKF